MKERAQERVQEATAGVKARGSAGSGVVGGGGSEVDRVRYVPIAEVDEFWPQQRAFFPLTPERMAAVRDERERRRQGGAGRAAGRGWEEGGGDEREVSLGLTIRLDVLPLVHFQVFLSPVPASPRPSPSPFPVSFFSPSPSPSPFCLSPWTGVTI